MKLSLSEVIYQLKSSFRRRFGADRPFDKNTEIVMNAAAPSVKKGYEAEWYEENGIALVRLKKPARWLAREATQNDDAKSSPTGRGHSQRHSQHSR